MLFLAWSVGAIVVQLVVYVLVSRLLHMSKEHIESGNVAFGGLLGRHFAGCRRDQRCLPVLEAIAAATRS